MTLKDKLEVEIMDLAIMDEVIDDIGKNLEYVADDFAIGFAQWVRKEAYYEHLTKEFFYKKQCYKSEKELLAIYKKENCL